MELRYEQGISLKDFLHENHEEFERRLFIEAVNVKEIVQEVKTVGSIDLPSNAHKLVQLLIDNKDMEIVHFAQREGQLWAKHSSLNLAVKLEWFQAIRSVLWDFIYNFERLSGNQEASWERFFALERQINTALDSFLRHFIMSYTGYKDELIKLHKMTIDDLAVPIIPLVGSVFIVPLLGTIDADRIKVIQEKLLRQIGISSIRTLIIDVAGIVFADASLVRQLFKILEGVGYMGCKAVVAGIKPEMAQSMVEMDICLNGNTETKGTLQQALEELGFRLQA